MPPAVCMGLLYTICPSVLYREKRNGWLVSGNPLARNCNQEEAGLGKTAISIGLSKGCSPLDKSIVKSKTV